MPFSRPIQGRPFFLSVQESRGKGKQGHRQRGKNGAGHQPRVDGFSQKEDGEQGDKNGLHTQNRRGQGEIALGQGPDGTGPTEKERTASKKSTPKPICVAGSRKKQNQRGGPSGHGKVGDAVDQAGVCAPTQAELHPPGAKGIKEGGDQREGQRHEESENDAGLADLCQPCRRLADPCRAG